MLSHIRVSGKFARSECHKFHTPKSREVIPVNWSMVHFFIAGDDSGLVTSLMQRRHHALMIGSHSRSPFSQPRRGRRRIGQRFTIRRIGSGLGRLAEFRFDRSRLNEDSVLKQGSISTKIDHRLDDSIGLCAINVY
jgi:hypothetical protein